MIYLKRKKKCSKRKKEDLEKKISKSKKRKKERKKERKCNDDIPHDVTAWTLPEIINCDWLDRVKRVKTFTGNRYCLYFRKYIL